MHLHAGGLLKLGEGILDIGQLGDVRRSGQRAVEVVVQRVALREGRGRSVDTVGLAHEEVVVERGAGIDVAQVDDAVAAVKAALDEGIVPGGGVTLINLINAISTVATEDESVTAGKQILKKALEQPFRILLTNAGINADEWLPQVKAAKTGFGVDVNRPAKKLVDLKACGIVDPSRVTKEALQNSVSIAGTSMTMGGLVVDIPEKKENSPMPPDMGGMGMM